MSNRKHVAIDGQFVSERVAQVVQAIREYSPELDVEWVPPTVRRPDQAAFRIIHKPLDAEPYVIFHVKTEDEFDARVLKRIIAGDQRNGKVTLNEFEAAEEAARRVAHQRWLDSIEEKNEMAHALLKTDKSVYKFNDNLIFKEGVPYNVAHEYRSKVL